MNCYSSSCGEGEASGEPFWCMVDFYWLHLICITTASGVDAIRNISKKLVFTALSLSTCTYIPSFPFHNILWALLGEVDTDDYPQMKITYLYLTLWRVMSFSISCTHYREKFLWPKLRAAKVYGYKHKCLECSATASSVSRRITEGLLKGIWSPQFTIPGARFLLWNRP